MYNVTAKLINLMAVPATEKYPASWKAQLLGENCFQDGQVKMEMLTLNIPETVFTSLQGKLQKDVSLPIAFFVSDGRLNTFFPKNIDLSKVLKAA